MVLIRRLLQPIVGYFLLVAVLQAALIGPGLALLFDRLIAASGERAIGNFDIALFLLTPAGLGFVLAAVVAGMIFLLFGLAGLMLLADAAMRGRSRPLIDAARGFFPHVGLYNICRVTLPGPVKPALHFAGCSIAYGAIRYRYCALRECHCSKAVGRNSDSVLRRMGFIRKPEM